jgi:hypothetical protein
MLDAKLDKIPDLKRTELIKSPEQPQPVINTDVIKIAEANFASEDPHGVLRGLSRPDSSLKDTEPVTDRSPDLEDYIGSSGPDSFPPKTYLTPEERKLTFHGTTGHEQAAVNFSRGFIGKSESYATHTQNLATSLSGRFSDGTVTVWDPSPETWQNPHGINLASKVPLPGEINNPDGAKLNRKNNSNTLKTETYIAPEYLNTVVSFTPDQTDYIRQFKQLLLTAPETVDETSFKGLIERFTSGFPHPEKVHIDYQREGSTLTVPRLLEVSAVKMYESALKLEAGSQSNPYKAVEEKQKFSGFPTYDVAPYKKFKQAHLVP